jgi:hypothetical protein
MLIAICVINESAHMVLRQDWGKIEASLVMMLENDVASVCERPKWK